MRGDDSSNYSGVRSRNKYSAHDFALGRGAGAFTMSDILL